MVYYVISRHKCVFAYVPVKVLTNAVLYLSISLVASDFSAQQQSDISLAAIRHLKSPPTHTHTW